MENSTIDLSNKSGQYLKYIAESNTTGKILTQVSEQLGIDLDKKVSSKSESDVTQKAVAASLLEGLGFNFGLSSLLPFACCFICCCVIISLSLGGVAMSSKSGGGNRINYEFINDYLDKINSYFKK